MKTDVKQILIIDDEESLANALVASVRRIGAEAHVAASAAQARRIFADQAIDLIVLDIGLPDGSGLDLLPDIRQTPVLVITAHGNLENAVQARRRGAAEYMVKPLDLQQFSRTLLELLDEPASTTELQAQRAEIEPGLADPNMLIGASAAMQPVFAQMAHACNSEVPVMLSGPTGSGKSLCARLIHQHSNRQAGPFVTLHCAALSEQLLDSELFGHEKNAFTGAGEARMGHVERAQGGTLFLDEIADISPALQTKLLRFVEEQRFVRVGGREDLEVELRLITATHQDLKQAVRDEAFREDLYYRLKVLEVSLPSLAERLEDLPTLCACFLAQAANSTGEVPQFSPEVQRMMQAYTWPGNVRELRHAIERAVAVCSGGLLLPRHFPAELASRAGGEHSNRSDPGLKHALNRYVDFGLDAGWDWSDFHDRLENELLRVLLERHDGKSTRLAKSLKMNRSTLLKKRKRFEKE